MKKMDLKSVVWKDGRFYVALNLDVDVSSFGKTKKEAIKNLEEALELCFEDEKPASRSQRRVEKPEVVSHSLAHA